MKEKIKVLFGAIVVSVISCIFYYGLFDTFFYVRVANINVNIILILILGMMVIIPFISSIIRVVAGYVCKKKLGFSSFQSKIMMLISCFLYMFEGYWYGSIYCHRLAFDEGLAFAIEIIFTLVIIVLEVLLLIGSLVIGHKIDVGKKVEKVKEWVNS
ncbi:MAG: hypothetical protein E7292_03910 [Lachnospiraceae bacterium]|nr:hypothetical protein [Lachnospiraceae bacterium]